MIKPIAGVLDGDCLAFLAGNGETVKSPLGRTISFDVIDLKRVSLYHVLSVVLVRQHAQLYAIQVLLP